MRVGVIQSAYIPWRGYFDFIASVDVFVFHDDLQYTKGDWRNRNRIKTEKGTEWLTVPVHYKTVNQLICETTLDASTDWLHKHIQKFQSNYRQAPHLNAALDILVSAGASQFSTISELNRALTKRLCDYLEIATPLLLSSELGLSGAKTDRLINLLKKLDASVYLSGPSAEAYLDKRAFHDNGIGLEYKTYDYAPYPQLWGPFEGAVTVLDLIANCGPDAKTHIRSKSADKLIVDPMRKFENE
jgi:hypothetical protein